MAGGFGGNVGHDPHLLYTLSAVQILALFDRIDVLDVEKVANCILFVDDSATYMMCILNFYFYFLRKCFFLLLIFLTNARCIRMFIHLVLDSHVFFVIVL